MTNLMVKRIEITRSTKETGVESLHEKGDAVVGIRFQKDGIIFKWGEGDAFLVTREDLQMLLGVK